MVTQDLDDFVRRAERFYNERLRTQLEQSHRDKFVALEPVSGDYFLGKTLSEAMGAAKAKYPDRLSHAVRIGHEAALHFGVSSSSGVVN
jgi:hypothetical protein